MLRQTLPAPAQPAFNPSNPRYPFITSLIALAMILTTGITTAEPPTPKQIFTATGISTADVTRLKNGEILSFPVTEPTFKTLANGLMMFVKSSPQRLAKLVRAGALFNNDPAMLAYGDPPANIGISAFDPFSFSAKYADEAINLLDVKAGQEFNLSQQELAALETLSNDPNLQADNAKINAVNQQYRAILFARYKAYLKQGLDGIAPYARENGTLSDASVDLKLFTLKNELLKLFDPELQRALLRYPKPLPSSTSSHFFWINRIVQSRPTAILYHQVIRVSDNAAVIIQNGYYAEHSFIASQLMIGAVPFEDGILIVHVLRSSTDHLAGFGQDLKRIIGRETLSKETLKQFGRLQAAFR